MSKNKKGASIKKELISLITYPYSDPSPVPEFGRLYPYNRFDGYTSNGSSKDWEMIVMENEFIKLWVNPAVGGKIWGAIEKATQKEFIYFNHSAKFRDVAMRGPWTSGGVETNMGIIGHTPSCSSPVDYFMRTNTDGSVSCFVGATDWPSRTNWTVEICLPADTAYFITRSSWYNNSGLEQSYYQWNNVGVKAAGNLEFIHPGNKHLGHDGKVFSWPKDEEDRKISFYNNNDFGEYKSYHVTGSYADFWGCYWHDDDFGFGHSAAYDEKPGKKIWIWGLSRYGMIWEDLLTDTDGQYIELQSGRLFNQSISPSSKTPFKHSSFLPYVFDQWDEYWFPVKNIGGLMYGNEQLSFNIIENEEGPSLHICANTNINHQLKVDYNGKQIFLKHIELAAMETDVIKLPFCDEQGQLKIWLNDVVIFNAAEQDQALSRPSVIPAAYDFDSVQALYLQAKEWERQRFYGRAITAYHTCLKKDPFYVDALTGLAGILLRQTQPDKSLVLIMTALSVDTYHPEANYLYGHIKVRINAIADAKDGFSIASQSINYRSAAYTELAKMFLKEEQLGKAITYINKALLANPQNRQAVHLKLIVSRLTNAIGDAKQQADELIQNNPLDHLARFELYQLGVIGKHDFQQGISSELPYETYLELNAFYLNLGLHYLCLDVLAMAPSYAMVSVYTAYIYSLQNQNDKANHHIDIALNQQPDFVFPHREEDVMVLEWAVNIYPSWKLKYYLALAYIQMVRTEEADSLLISCKNEPDFYVFYIMRANLQKNIAEQDLIRACNIAPTEWRPALILSKYLGDKNRWQEALTIVDRAFQLSPDNYYLGLQLANCYRHTSNFQEGIALMSSLNVLPNEGALDGRNVWKETQLFAALQAIRQTEWQQAINYIELARNWPENLGVGKPYQVDERLETFLELYCLKQSGAAIPAGLVDYMISYREKFPATPISSNDFLSLYVLLHNYGFEQGELLLIRLRQKSPKSLVNQWIEAFMDDNKNALDNLALIEPVKQEALPYEILFDDRSFTFIKEMYRLDFFKMPYKVTE